MRRWSLESREAEHKRCAFFSFCSKSSRAPPIHIIGKLLNRDFSGCAINSVTGKMSDYSDDFGPEEDEEEEDEEEDRSSLGNEAEHDSFEAESAAGSFSNQPLDWPLSDFTSVPPPTEDGGKDPLRNGSFDDESNRRRPEEDKAAAEDNNDDDDDDDDDSTKGPRRHSLLDESPSIIHSPPDSINDNTSNLPTTDKALRQKVMETSLKLVKEGERNVALGLRLEETSSKLARVQSEVDEFSQLLLKRINGGITNVENYQHVPLAELLRLRLQESDQVRDDKEQERERVSLAPPYSPALSPSAVGGIQKLERQLATAKQHNRSLQRKVTNLQAALKKADSASGDLDMLKAKMTKAVERSRTEGELRSRSDKEAQELRGKIEMLSEQNEKLMVHLKHEGTGKVRALKDLSLANREIGLLQSRTSAMTKRNARKDQAIVDLKDNAELLEKQLKKMDEKYSELRLKLDWTRTQTSLALKKKNVEVQQLQSKLAWQQHGGGGGGADTSKTMLAGTVLEDMSFSYQHKSKLINSTSGKSRRRGRGKSGGLSP